MSRSYPKKCCCYGCGSVCASGSKIVRSCTGIGGFAPTLTGSSTTSLAATTSTPSSGIPRVVNVSASVAWSDPAVIPGFASGIFTSLGAIWGIYKKITINGSSIEFDTTSASGNGVVVTPSKSTGDYTGSGAPLSIELVREDVTLNALSYISSSSPATGIGVAYQGGYGVNQLYRTTYSGSPSNYQLAPSSSNGVSGGDGATALADMCAGATGTGTFTGSGGSISYAFRDGSSVSKTSLQCRDCPRVIEVSGTLWLACDPTTEAPGYDEVANTDHSTEEVTPPKYRACAFTARMTQVGVSKCQDYACEWRAEFPGDATISNNGYTIDAGGSDGLALTRIGESVYKLSYGGPARWEDDGITDNGWFVITSGKDPTTASAIEDYALPHEWREHDASGVSHAYPYGSLNTNKSYVTVEDGGATFTSNSISVSEGTCKQGDPQYWCEREACTKCRDCSASPGTLTGTSTVSGFTGSFSVTRVASNPCRYEWDQPTHYGVVEFVEAASNLAVRSMHARTWSKATNVLVMDVRRYCERQDAIAVVGEFPDQLQGVYGSGQLTLAA